MGQVYIARNKTNDKYYIGQTVQTLKQRFAVHKNKGHYFYNSLKKNGLDNFYITSIEMPDTALSVMEDLLMDHFDSLAPNGYNLKGAGKHGKHSAETKKKISELQIGRKHSEETKRKMSKARKGKNHGFKKGHIPWNKGGTHSEEARKKMSELRKGRPGPFLNEKRPDMTGSKHPNARAIDLIHSDGTEEYFGCMSDACRKYDLRASGLTGTAKGTYKQHKGFKVRYVKGD